MPTRRKSSLHGRAFPGGSLTKFVATAIGGLAAGATAAHLLYTQGHRYGIELRPQRPKPLVAADPTPEDYDAREPGRGRLAQRPEHIPSKGWVDIAWRSGAAYLGDRVGFVAGGVTFFVLLSMFPALAVFLTIYGLFADPANANAQLQFLYSVLPSNVAQFISGEMTRLAANTTGELTLTLVGTFALSLWTANNGVKTLFYGLNVAYSEIERRNLVNYNLLCMAFTIGGMIAVLFLSGLVVGVPVVLALLGLEDEFAALSFLRWPILMVGYVGALTLIYRFGPCRSRARWRWLTPGAIVAALLSVLLSALFSWYLTTFVRPTSYGPLAAAMGFLLWTWITVQIVLMGAKLNAAIEHQTAVDTTTGRERALGDRGAVVADSVGPRRGNPAALAFTMKHAEAMADRVLKKRIAPGN